LKEEKKLAQHIEKKIYRIIFNGFYNKVRSWIKTWALHSQIVVHIFPIISIYGRPQTFKKKMATFAKHKIRACVFAQKQIAQVTKILSFIEQWFNKMNKKFTRSKFPIDGLF